MKLLFGGYEKPRVFAQSTRGRVKWWILRFLCAVAFRQDVTIGIVMRQVVITVKRRAGLVINTAELMDAVPVIGIIVAILIFFIQVCFIVADRMEPYLYMWQWLRSSRIVFTLAASSLFGRLIRYILLKNRGVSRGWSPLVVFIGLNRSCTGL